MKDRMVRGKNTNRLRPDIKSDSLPAGVTFDEVTRKYSYTEASRRIPAAFDRLLAGETLVSIAEDLGWNSATALRGTLKCHWWIGEKTCLKQRVDKKWDEARDRMSDGRKAPREFPIIVPTNLTEKPLVTRQVFFGVQELLNRNHRQFTQRQSRSNDFLCTGLLYCSCGRKMYHKHDKRPGKPSYYLCSSNCNGLVPCGNPMIDARKSDSDVWCRLLLYTASGTYLTDKVKSAITGTNENGAFIAIQDLKGGIETLQKKKASILKLIEETGFLPDLAARYKSLDESVAHKKQMLFELESAAPLLSDCDLKAVVRTIRKKFWGASKLAMSDKKALMIDVITRISITTHMDEDPVLNLNFRLPRTP